MANIVAKRFVFAPQQRRFSQLDDVIDTGHGESGREEKLPSTRTRTVEAVERAGWLVGQPVPTPACPAPQRRAGAALAREMLPALRAAPHYSAAHVRRLHARARPHFCRPGGALAGRAALAWTQTPAVPGSARRVRLAPNPEPADRSPGQYGKARRAPCRAGRLVALLLAARGNGEQQEATRERARKHQGYVRQTRRRGGDGDDERGG